MRSGALHLKKKMEDVGHETFIPLSDAGHALSLVEETDASASSCELDEPLWSVVSFDQREAGGLTYAQAILLLTELDANNINGLCIITDAAAERIHR